MTIQYPYVELPELAVRLEHRMDDEYMDTISIDFLTTVVLDELKQYHGSKLIDVGEPYVAIKEASFGRYLVVHVVIDPNTTVSDKENAEIIRDQCIMNQI